MSQLQGLVEHVETWQARSFAQADAAISDTVVYIADAAPFFTEAGTCTVDIDGLTYTATPTSADDPDDDYLTLSPALTVAVTEGDPITLVPAAEVKWAWISFPGDDSGDLMKARVPHELVGYVSLTDGPREMSVRETVVVETDPQPTVVDVPNQRTSINATTTPIIVTTEDGESVRIDGAGISTFTNDPVPIRTIPARTSLFASDGAYLYADPIDDGKIRKFDVATGVEVTSGGFPITGFNPGDIAVDGGFIYTKDVATGDIRKFNASTGAEVLTGFPIAGGFDFLAVDDGFLYARDNTSSDIRKFNASTGAEVLTGFPIAGTFNWLAASDGYIYADSGLTEIRKFDAATGAEDTTGFPANGRFNRICAHGGFLFGQGNTDKAIHKFDAGTGEEIVTSGFPLEGPFNPSLAVDAERLYATDDVTAEIRVFNNVENYRSTLADSSDGTYAGHAITVSDVRSTGTGIFEGRLEGPADNLSVTTTKMSRVAAQNSSGAGTPLVIDFDTFEGSGTSGETAFWDEFGGTITIDVDGVYDISALPIVAANITGNRRVRLLVNGAAALDRFEPSASASVSWKFPLALKLFLSAGDTIQLEIQQTSGATLSVAGSWLTIGRVGVLAA